MNIKNSKNETESLDYKIIEENDDFWIAEGGLPYLLTIPKENVSGGEIGKYIMPGCTQFAEMVGSEKSRSIMTEKLKTYITEEKPINLTLEYENKEKGFLVLTSPDWPGFSFLAKWLSYADRYILLKNKKECNGETVEMQGCKTKDGIAPEIENLPYILVQSIKKEVPQKDNVYKVVVTNVASRRITVECNGRPGYIYANDMNPGVNYKPGIFIDAKCIYADHTGKRYRFNHCDREETNNVLKKGNIISGAINHFEEEEGALYVNFDKYINQKTFCSGNLNAASWIESGLFGEEIRLKIKNIIKGHECPYVTELLINLDENEDPYNLPVGTKVTIDFAPGDKYIHFTHNNRQYGLYKETLCLPDFLNDILEDKTQLNGVVTRGFGDSNIYTDPEITINSFAQFCSEHNDETSKEFEAEIIGTSETGLVIKTDDGYYINVQDNDFDYYWPKYHRPETGDVIKCFYDTVPESKNPHKKGIIPLYDRSSEIEYKLPQGSYVGEAVRAYLNNRFVVKTKQGPVTAICEAPSYIQTYFYRNNTPVEVDVDINGNAVMHFSGIRYKAPELNEGAEVHITPVARVSNGILVEFENKETKCYGYIHAEDFAWTHSFDIDLEKELNRLSQPGKIVMAHRINKPDKTGIFFTLKDPNDNPYKSPEFDDLQLGSEKEVTVVKYIKYGNLLVEYNGLKGIIFSNYTGCFRIQSNRPARYIGERIKARVQEFDRDRGTLEFRASSVDYDRIQTKLKKNETYRVIVRGYADENVIVQCGDIIGSLSNSRFLYEKIFVTPEHFRVGTELEAVCKKLEFKNNGRSVCCLFSVTEKWIKKFYEITTSVLSEEAVTGKVAGFIDQGLIMTFPFRGYSEVYGIMPSRAALENVEGIASDLRNVYHIGEEIEIVPAFPVKNERTIYVIPANCKLKEEYRKAKQDKHIVHGTITSFNKSEGYTIALDNGLTAFMNVYSSSHSLWFTDIQPIGVPMDFLMYGADFIGYRPLVSRKAVIDNSWDRICLDEGDVVDVTVEGSSGSLVLISYQGVYDYIESAYLPAVAGQPWDKSYKPLEQDFPKGKRLKLKMVKKNIAKRHNTLVPYYGILQKDVLAEVVNIASDGLWMRLSDANQTIGLVPDAEISHAQISAADGFFKTGDKFHVRYVGMDTKTFTPLLSRKALLDRTIPKQQNKPVVVTLRRNVEDKALVLAFDKEMVLPENILVPTDKAGKFTVEAGTFNKYIKKA